MTSSWEKVYVMVPEAAKAAFVCGSGKARAAADESARGTERDEQLSMALREVLRRLAKDLGGPIYCKGQVDQKPHRRSGLGKLRLGLGFLPGRCLMGTTTNVASISASPPFYACGRE